MDTLIVFAERCVHQIVAQAGCDACVRTCPQAAWKTNADGLSFDNAMCDGCGLCVAACPSEALALPQAIPVVRVAPAGKEILIACERADPVAQALARTACQSGSAGQISRRQEPGTARLSRMDDSKPTAGTTPCLQALTPHWVLHWAGQHAGSRVRYASGDCQRCARGRGPAWQDRFATATAGLKALGRPLPALQPITFQAWQQAVTQQSAPDAGRRGLLRALLRPPGAVAALPQQKPMTSARAPLLKLLRDQGAGRALWAVELQRERCTWCMACAQLCQSGALQFAADKPPQAAPDQTRQVPDALRSATDRFTLDMQRCTGCGVCVDACDQQALRSATVPELGQSVSTHIALHRLRCTQCGVDFHQLPRGQAPVSQAPGHAARADEAPRCPACNQGRPHQRDRWVQVGEGA